MPGNIGDMRFQYLRGKGRDINDSVIDEAEVLSGEVYYYNRKKNEVVMRR